MSFTPSIHRTNNETQLLQTLASPYHLELARKLSQDRTYVVSMEFLGMDILSKIENLAKLEAEIVSRNPAAKPYTEFLIKTFTYRSAQKLR